MTKQAFGGIMNIEIEREVKIMDRKTDFETMKEIFKKAGNEILFDEMTDYFEIRCECGTTIGFDFDSQGNFKKLLD